MKKQTEQKAKYKLSIFKKRVSSEIGGFDEIDEIKVPELVWDEIASLQLNDEEVVEILANVLRMRGEETK